METVKPADAIQQFVRQAKTYYDKRKIEYSDHDPKWSDLKRRVERNPKITEDNIDEIGIQIMKGEIPTFEEKYGAALYAVGSELTRYPGDSDEQADIALSYFEQNSSGQFVPKKEMFTYKRIIFSQRKKENDEGKYAILAIKIR